MMMLMLSLVLLSSTVHAWVLPPQSRMYTTRLYAEDPGLNELHTQLRQAVRQQDFQNAGQISDQLAERLYPDYKDLDSESKKQKRRRMSWVGLGGAPWLVERLDALQFTFPTTIQINALEAVNALLADDDDSTEEASFEQRVLSTDHDMGVVVSGTTGSGKTLSYAVPLLSTLSDSLFLRQRLRISDEESIQDTAGDLADRIRVVTSPKISRKKESSKSIATGAAVASLGRSGKDVKSPLALVVVPTRELGVQTAQQLYQLVGGSVPGSSASEQLKTAEKYAGPKGVRIGCVLEDEEAAFGLKLQTDIAVTMPQYLGKLVKDGDIDPTKLRVVVFDEADLALEQTPDAVLSRMFTGERDLTRLTLLVGASVTEAVGNLAVRSQVLPDGQSYIANATRFTPLRGATLADAPSASLNDLDVCLYTGLQHERVVVPAGESGLLILTRLLRQELQSYDEAINAQNGLRSNKPLASPRVVVFFPDEPQAKAAIEPLRDALWGEHRLCVLLPKTGVSPLTIMEQFKRNETSVMLATPNSVRGLDFPALTHVYALYLPMDDPREYIHLAGRVGRVGHETEGRVISVLPEREAGKLEELAESLGFEFTDVPVPMESLVRTDDGEIDEESIDIEKLRRSFEDTISLLGLADDVDVVDGQSSPESSAVSDDDEEAESFQ